jgi:hypothetical protein
MKRRRDAVGHRAPDPPKLEDALYNVAMREIDSGKVHQDIWQKALELSRGDDRRAIGAYVRIRVRSLLEAHEAREG